MTEANAKILHDALESTFRRLLADGVLFINEQGEVECVEFPATAAESPTVKAGSRKRGAVAERSEVSA